MKSWMTIFVASFFLTMTYAQYDIRIPPSITRGPPRNLIYRSGDSVTLDCRGKGVPDVTYEWKRNGFVFDQYLHNVHKGSDDTMTIQPATSVDEGFYQCFVTNRHGTALSVTAHLQMAFLESVSGTRAILEEYAPFYLPFYIECDRRGSFPKPTYIWEIANDDLNRTWIPLLPTEEMQIAENGDLHFGLGAPTPFKLAGKQLYRCFTYNPYLDIKEGGNYTKLVLVGLYRRRRHYSFKTFGFSSESPTVAVIGGSGTLRCFFYYNENAKISWVGPKYTLPTGRYTLDTFNTSLTIHGVTAADEGYYVCNGSTTEGNRSRELYMRVEALPMFPTVNDAPYDVRVTEGETVTFSCNPSAKPEAKIVWLQDGKELDPNNPPKRFVFSNDNKSLTIRDVCRDCVDRESKTDLMVIQCNASNVHGYAFAQGYLNVVNTSCNNETDKGRTISQPCPGNTTEPYCDNEIDKEHSLLWKRTSAGKDIYQPCPGNATGLCFRKCLPVSGDAKPHWSKPNYNGCFDKEFKDLLDRVSNLEETALKNQTVIGKIASEFSVVTNKSEGLSPGNLNASVMLINRLAILRNGSEYSPNENEIKSIVRAASNVLRTINSKAWKELTNVNKTMATAILYSLEVYGRSLSMLNITEHSIVEGDSLVLEAWSFEKSNLPHQIKFPNRSLWGENRGDEISISMETLNSGISTESQSTLNMWGVYYRTIHDYLPGNKDNDVNSRILSFSIGGLTTNEILKPPVLITLRHNEEKTNCFPKTCTFWKFNRSEWDSTGCSAILTNSTHTICSCDHLTNFAMLMSINHSGDKALSIISIIGCSISVTALILTIVVYAFTWKQSKSSRATILLNLCVALIIAYIVFLAGADTFQCQKYPEVGCQTVTALLHYFFLAAFFIMLAEGVEMVLYMFFVFHVRRTRETIMLVATAWVLPLIIVGVSRGATRPEKYVHEKACWLSAKNGLIWTFVGPVLCIITVNFVILILVLRLVSQKKDLLAKNRRKRDEIRATIWNLSVTCPVLGLGWLFGIFSFAFDSVVFEYLFVIANSLQGLLIFIIYALFYNKKMNEKISSVYSKYFCRCRKTDTQMTSAPDQSTLSRAATRMTTDEEQSTVSMAATQMTSNQELFTISMAATQMTPTEEQCTISLATQITSTEEQSTRSTAATQMTLAQEQSTISVAATLMASAQELSTISMAETQMTPTQELSTISMVETQMTPTQEQSTSSIAATQITPTQEQSTISVAATLMATAQELFTILVEATQITSAPEESTNSVAATQMPLAQEQPTNSTAATQMASVQEQSTFAVAATQMTSTEEHSTSSIAAKKKKGFLGVPTAFKFCEEMGGQHNLKRTETQPMSTEDSVAFDSAH